MSATATAATRHTAHTAHRSQPRRRRQVWRGGRSLRDMHSLTGLSVNYIRRALSGVFMPRLDKLRLLARALDMSVHDLAVQLEITDPAPLKPRRGFYPIVDPKTVNRSQVARDTGLSLAYVSRILSEDPKQDRQPRPDDLAVLAKYFRCSMDHLIRCWKL